jgi:DNA-binding PadR family transcriptional regulator
VISLESEIWTKIHKKLVKHFLDVLILMKLKKRSLSGYDVIAFVHNEFGTLLSSGSVYSCLYLLERQGLIKGEWAQRKRMYTLTDKGEKTVKAISDSKKVVLNFIDNFIDKLLT